MRRELLVLKILETGMRVKAPETGDIFSLKTSTLLNVVELDTVLFEVEKDWTFQKQKYLSGKVIDNKFILENIPTPKIEYTTEGLWDPYKVYGNEAEVKELFSDYIQEGYREEIVLKDYSGYGFYQPDEDPLLKAEEMEDWNKAYDVLTKLWEDYPECIDALVYIGNLYFDGEGYLNHCHNCYKVATAIVERNLPENFDGIMQWGFEENRPYLRALYFYSLTLWRLRKFSEALSVAEKVHRLCPADNLGARALIGKLKKHEEWPLDRE